MHCNASDLDILAVFFKRLKMGIISSVNRLIRVYFSLSNTLCPLLVIIWLNKVKNEEVPFGAHNNFGLTLKGQFASKLKFSNVLLPSMLMES